jgi:hypothetical protein
MVNENSAKYYETTDFSELIKATKNNKTTNTAKRITLNISEKIYDEANELDSYMKMGYQNVLKTAMTIGLSELFNRVSSHKIIRAPQPIRKQQSIQRTTTPARQARIKNGVDAGAPKL